MRAPHSVIVLTLRFLPPPSYVQDEVQDSSMTQAQLLAFQQERDQAAGGDTAGGKVVRYRANVKGVVRAEADLKSAKVGYLEKGEELQVVEMKMVDGKERARFLKSNTTNGGWVSVLAKSGRPVLTLLD